MKWEMKKIQRLCKKRICQKLKENNNLNRKEKKLQVNQHQKHSPNC
jgi:hypothetical protein